MSDPRGTGWRFPVGTEPGFGTAMSTLDDSVEESIRIIIGTARGERVMRPTFGCGIHDHVFATRDASTAGLIEFEVMEALVEFEPRAEVLRVWVAPGPGEAELLVELDYRVRATNNVFNLVYPFYLQEEG
ncbi:GPW/gp25 family protein [Streptomyces sp. UC4497]